MDEVVGTDGRATQLLARSPMTMKAARRETLIRIRIPKPIVAAIRCAASDQMLAEQASRAV